MSLGLDWIVMASVSLIDIDAQMFPGSLRWGHVQNMRVKSNEIKKPASVHW